MPPQPSPCGPHRPPHASGTHPPPGGHAPQSIVPPQPSPDGPHFTPSSAHVLGVQLLVPHFRGVLAPQVAGAAQVPQPSAPPQPSAHEPHSYPSAAHVVGVQLTLPHFPGTPPPPQLEGGVHAPHARVL